MQSPHSSTHKLIKVLLIIFSILVIYWGYEIFFPRQLPTKEYSLVINRGEPLNKLSKRLKNDQVIKSPHLFVWATRLMGKDKKIAAGMYILNKPMSLIDLIERLSNGKPDEISITILDGWNFKQIRNLINTESQISHLTESMTDQQIRNELKISAPSMEGLLYPSTYFIAPHQSDLEVIQNAYKLMQDKLTKSWLSRGNNTVYKTPYELLIMASLIQKETSESSDMFLVSTVFNNRIKINMRLQDDPAVFYGLANRDRITRVDFAIDTPYNTYLHKGLPPTPICTPSQNALNAAAKPPVEPTLLYFLAIGNGRTKFSSTYGDHNHAINKYLKKTGK